MMMHDSLPNWLREKIKPMPNAQDHDLGANVADMPKNMKTGISHLCFDRNIQDLVQTRYYFHDQLRRLRRLLGILSGIDHNLSIDETQPVDPEYIPGLIRDQHNVNFDIRKGVSDLESLISAFDIAITGSNDNDARPISSQS